MGAITLAQGHVSLILNDRDSCSFDVHVDLVHVFLPRREHVKVEKQCVTQPDHELHAVTHKVRIDDFCPTSRRAHMREWKAQRSGLGRR
eukprot:150893-Rhodomonas_salina.1